MGLDVNFSKVKYKDIAALVGLDRFGNPEDIETFELHRSRIPTLFRFIIEDMDPMLMQYGHLSDHITEEATSRFMSPVWFRFALHCEKLTLSLQILNHLIAQFGFKFRNLPESIIKGRLPTRGRMQYYFRAFGRISILVVEAKFEIRNIPARFDTIAQVIAECDGQFFSFFFLRSGCLFIYFVTACDWNNSMNNFGLPVFGILWGGVAVQFFKYDGTMKAYPFFRGAFSGDPLPLQNGIVLPDSALAESTLPFILTMRQISETVFDSLLRGYIASPEAYRDGPATTANRRGSLDKWDEALESARCALSRFRDAESKRQRSDKAGASQAVLQAQEALNHR